MDDTITKEFNNNEIEVGGSIFRYGNTTYSGCDIKVVINIYQGDQKGKEDVRATDAEIKQKETQIAEVDKAYAGALSTLENAKQGTQEYEYSFKLVRQLQQKQISNQQDLGILMDNRVRLDKGKMASTTKVLAEVQTLSVSTARDKRAVRACGTVYPKAFTRGPREIAGSMIFTVFNQHVLYELLDAHPSDFDAVAYTSALIDQLPPLDITIAFANEYGSISRMGIYGVEFVNEGQVMSIEDLITENTTNYVARDIDPMRSVAQMGYDMGTKRDSLFSTKSASSLLLEDDYEDYKTGSPFDRFSKRRNPFL